MILDDLNKFSNYVDINPLFPLVEEFLKSHDLTKLPLGKTLIAGDDLFVNIVDSPVKSKDEAKLESHNVMIDIQIPISAGEMHGYTPRSALPEVNYDEKNDISFYKGRAEIYFNLKPTQFVIYFPHDGHAPAITTTGLRKAIFKVRN